MSWTINLTPRDLARAVVEDPDGFRDEAQRAGRENGVDPAEVDRLVDNTIRTARDWVGDRPPR